MKNFQFNWHILTLLFCFCFTLFFVESSYSEESQYVKIYKESKHLATLDIKKGQLGELKLENETPEAKELKELWEEEIKDGTVEVMMHLPTRDNTRGPYGATIYKPDSDSYSKGVSYFFMSKDYYAELER